MQRQGASDPTGKAALSARNGINWVNSGLMVLACGAAIAAPFQVFLIAYAVLGPLHYLTEISWLHDRNYFTRGNNPRRWWLTLVALASAVLTFGYVSNDLLGRPISPTFEIALVYLVFAAAAVALYVRRWHNAIGILLVIALGLVFFSSLRTYAVLAYFLVTIIHVLIFTGAFVLYGALKTRSWVAVLSLLIFVSCAIAAATITAPFAAPGERTRELYGGFEQLNSELLRLFGQPQRVYDSAGVGAMRLIAFAYLYHYLNWFSKTSIIKWHEVKRSRVLTILAVWLAGGLAYLYDFRLGFAIFYILSMLHVLLEFPLNHQTFVEIGKSLRVRRSPGRPSVLLTSRS
jgi:hypothetical protein